MSDATTGATRRDQFVENVLQGKDRSATATLLRGLLTPLALLHQAGLEAYLLPFRVGARKPYRLPVPVVAIGNLSSGGTGKTPMAVLVAQTLQADGLRVALLSRGHGGTGERGREARVVSDGETIFLTPREAGDEPVLLARLLRGIPVIVARDRRVSGRLAVERFAPDVIVCDDALQYWQLHRDLDIVLLDARRPFDNGYVLPRGLLREAPSRLARAGIVVLTRADRADAAALDNAKSLVARYAPRASAFTAIHAPVGWVRANSDNAPLPPNALCGQTVTGFAGIADGAAFAETVTRLGARLAHFDAFWDHYVYDAATIASVADTAQRSPHVSAVVTTEKDLVKVAPLWPSDAPPLLALRIGMQLDDAARFFANVRSLVSPTKTP